MVKLKMLVCIKQVPDAKDIKINPITNTLERIGVPSIVNPFDTYALEMATRLKEENGGEITVITMGPKQAESALRECLSVGADSAVLVTDKAFGGSDTMATSYILSCAIKKLGHFDIIFCGKQAIDGDTGQVGPGIAEQLGIAQVTYARGLKLDKEYVQIERELDDGIEIIEVKTPVVITVLKNRQEPRLATIRSKLLANKEKIRSINSTDLSIDMSCIGYRGSPTRVKKVYSPAKKTQGIIIQGIDAKESAKRLVKLLNKKKILQERRNEK